MLTFEQLAETFSPGESIKEELEERGWSQRDLASIMGVQPSIVSGIINGTKSVSLDLARNLAAAFGTSTQYWVNMETAYRLHQSPSSHGDTSARSDLYRVAPVNEMIKRGWIESTNDVYVLKARVEAFFDRPLNDIEVQDELACAARKGTEYGVALSPSQKAWLRRAQILTKAVQAESFTDSSVEAAIAKLRPLMGQADEIRHVPRVLAECGIRFLIIEHLPQTRIDGVCFWSDRQPVIALSMRYDRLDYFWFTLMHELGHIARRDGITIALAPDVDLVGEKAALSSIKPEIEQLADMFASENTIKQSEMDNFIARVKPLFSKVRIQGFALRQGVHPALVIGQLQHKGAIHWSHSREFLVKVRDIIISSTLTDGWGQILPNIT